MTTNLKKLEEKLLKETAQIKFVEDKKFIDLEDLIQYSITRQKGKPAGYNFSIEMGVPQTVKITSRQRKQLLGTSRSLHDLFILCRTYFPESTMEGVFAVLKKFAKQNKLNTWYCCTFGKRMFRYESVYNTDLDSLYTLT